MLFELVFAGLAAVLAHQTNQPLKSLVRARFGSVPLAFLGTLPLLALYGWMLSSAWTPCVGLRQVMERVIRPVVCADPRRR